MVCNGAKVFHKHISTSNSTFDSHLMPKRSSGLKHGNNNSFHGVLYNDGIFFDVKIFFGLLPRPQQKAESVCCTFCTWVTLDCFFFLLRYVFGMDSFVCLFNSSPKPDTFPYHFQKIYNLKCCLITEHRIFYPKQVPFLTSLSYVCYLWHWYCDKQIKKCHTIRYEVNRNDFKRIHDETKL